MTREEKKLDVVVEENGPHRRETNVNKRRISEETGQLGMNLISKDAIKKRKVTEDIEYMNRTGSIANGDDFSYQSRIVKIDNPLDEIQRKEECTDGYNSLDFLLTGLDMILTNEKENTYYPIVNFSVSEVHFEKYITTKASRAQTCT